LRFEEIFITITITITIIIILIITIITPFPHPCLRLPVIVNRVGRGDPYGMEREVGPGLLLVLAISEIEMAFLVSRPPHSPQTCSF
jgi:hypothetical protein